MSASQPLDHMKLSDAEIQLAARKFYEKMKTRKSVRDFSSYPIPINVLENAILTAGTAPSGANLQPWHFVVVRNKALQRQIRKAAEAEEQKFYAGKAPNIWLDVLSHLDTNAEKSFLETAPALIVIFQKSKTTDHRGIESKTYYPKESVGIATGFLITALHCAGLVTLTHTPSPMRFLNEILDRPSQEKPFLLLVVGFPSENCEVPMINKKSLGKIASFH